MLVMFRRRAKKEKMPAAPFGFLLRYALVQLSYKIYDTVKFMADFIDGVLCILPSSPVLFFLDGRGRPSLAVKQSPDHFGSNHVSQIHADHDCYRPLLPLAIPVKRDRHGTEPCTDKCACETTEGLIQGCRSPNHSLKVRSVDTVDVEDREECQHCKVSAAEEGMRGVSEEGRAE